MRTYLLTVLCISSLIGCQPQKQIDDGGQSSGDQGCPSSPDMKPAAAPCPAAKGLTGDNLLCVDFANPQTTLTGLTAQGWRFDVAMLDCPKWEIANGLLQVIDFPTFKGTCGFATETISMAQVQSYAHLTLSIQHRIDLIDQQQWAKIFLNSYFPSTRIIWQATGERDVPRQQTTITLDSATLPSSLKTGFEWLFDLSSYGPFTAKGWQIESIAINGTKD